MASFHALIPCTSFYTPNPTAKSLQQLSTFNNGIGSYLFSCHSHKIRGGCKFSWNFPKRFNLYASLSSNGNGLEAAAAASKEFKDDEFIVVNFYRFVFVKDPEEEVSKHLHFMKDRNIHGRIYLNEQGINAQYSGPSKDALSYVEWVKEDPRFSEILVQVSRATSGHAFPKLKLRYKPSLVQVRPSDPLADADKEKTDVLMYCTGGIRCDVYSTILRSIPLMLFLHDLHFFLVFASVHFSFVCDRVYIWKLLHSDDPRLCLRIPFSAKLCWTAVPDHFSHYLENEGPTGWVGNLFVFYSRLSLPPSTYKPEIGTEASGKQEVSHSFAQCYICGSQVSELRHRNCTNLDCNLLFLCCLECVDDYRGCCCMNCTSAP